jgi:hypothetical protein
MILNHLLKIYEEVTQMSLFSNRKIENRKIKNKKIKIGKSKIRKSKKEIVNNKII